MTHSNSTNSSESILTMSCIGKSWMGRFGNQIFQYAFLRICAKNSGAKIETAPWIGQTLFGHQDPPISKRLPPGIEDNPQEQTMFDVVPEFQPYLEKLAEAKSIPVGAEALSTGITNVDLWGFFQFHTRFFRPYRDYFCSLFEPIPPLKSALENSVDLLRSRNKTLVGIHVRRGDYITNPRLGIALVYPSSCYVAWLESIWNDLEDPVLILCSDDLDSILPDFEEFSPITYKDLKVEIPQEMQHLNLEFYVDFFMLTQCDVVCASNSTFSFAACMLNNSAQMFYRPHWDFSTKFTSFDPWDSLITLKNPQHKLLKSFTDIISVTYKTQGIKGMFKSLFVYVPVSWYWWIKFRGYMGYKAQGIKGGIKTILYTLGLHFVWKQ